MIRGFFGLIFLIYAIGMPIAFFKAGNHKQMESNLVGVIGVIVFEFLFIYFAVRLLRKKKIPQKKFYGEDYRMDSNRGRMNVSQEPESRYGYSSYNSNTVIHTNNQSFSYTEININSDRYDKKDEEKVEEKAEEAPKKVSLTCPGCGAKVKVYRKQFTDCEYCGTPVETQ